MNSGIYTSSQFYARYPGQKTYEASSAEPTLPLGMPGFVYKINPRIGISGYALPGGLGTDLKLEKIPVYVLNQMQFVDAKGRGTENGVVKFNAGFRIFSQFALGIDVSYLSYGAAITVTPSGSDDVLAKIKLVGSNLGVRAGMRFDVIPGRVSLGLAADIFSKTSQSMNVSSSLFSDQDAANGAGQSSTDVASPLTRLVAGTQVAIASKVHVLADLDYQRAGAATKQFSLVDFKEKTRDVHDTLSLRAGAIFNLISNGKALLGFAYLPASLGQGTSGADGLSGFNTLDLLMVSVGQQSLRPTKQFAAGGQFGFLQTADKRGKETAYFYALSIAIGLSYAVSSLGVDETGEQPAAYYQKVISIPVGFVYRL